MNIIKGARGRITGQFGDQNVPGANVRSHLGIDIGHGDMTPADLRVIAPAGGQVTIVGAYGSYGNRIVIEHGNGWSTLLAHLERIDVAPGPIAVGDDIGEMGSTGGDWPVHLHQELRRYGVPVDPEPYLTSTPAGGASTIITNPEEEEEEMKTRQIHATIDGKIIRAAIVPGTGYFVKWTESGGTYANAIATGLDTGPSVGVTPSLFGVFEREAIAMRPKGALTIELVDAEE